MGACLKVIRARARNYRAALLPTAYRRASGKRPREKLCKSCLSTATTNDICVAGVIRTT